MLRVTLATRLALIAVVALFAISLLIATVFYLTSVREGEFARPSPSRLSAIAELIERSAPDMRRLILDAVSSPQFAVRLDAVGVTPEPRPVSQEMHARLRELYADALPGREVSVTPAPAASDGRRFPRLSRAVSNAVELRIALHTGETLVVDAATRLPVTRLGLPVGLGAGLIGTIIGLIALLVMQRETRPLARLAAAVDRVDLSADPPPLPEARRSAPEIRAVIAAFNRLQARLGEMMRARMTLVGGIAHDVRTFATRLRLRVDKIPDPVEQQRAIADIDDMIRLLDDALLSSRVGAGQLSQEMVEFAAVVIAEADDRRAQGGHVDVAIDEAARGAIVLGDRLALRRIVANIVDNAVKYGHAAHVRMKLERASVILTVDDDGPGIPSDRRQAMLEPFNRLEASRNRTTGGAGLGLAVVRSLVEAHDGTIEMSDAPGGGVRVRIALPLFRPT
ncbi:HAMP domain-containing protein [Bradyrhizobium sp. BRP22]|nr:HAMP domain-containing protein [Bradyrhizobium sp. BRP22]